MNIHKTADTLPIYNYQQIVNTKNFMWLYCFDFKNGEQPPNIPNHSEEELSNIWANIENEIPTKDGESEEVLLYKKLALATWAYSLFKQKKDDRRMFFNLNLVKKLNMQLNESIEAKNKQEKDNKFNCIETIIIINSKLNLGLNQFTTDTTTFWKAYHIYNDVVESERKQLEKTKK